MSNESGLPAEGFGETGQQFIEMSADTNKTVETIMDSETLMETDTPMLSDAIAKSSHDKDIFDETDLSNETGMNQNDTYFLGNISYKEAFKGSDVFNDTSVMTYADEDTSNQTPGLSFPGSDMSNDNPVMLFDDPNISNDIPGTTFDDSTIPDIPNTTFEDSNLSETTGTFDEAGTSMGMMHQNDGMLEKSAPTETDEFKNIVKISRKMKPPPEIELRKSEVDSEDIGAWCVTKIEEGQIYGPFKGYMNQRAKLCNYKHAWEIWDKEAQIRQYILNATNPQYGDWMRYVNGTHDADVQNIISIQRENDVYYQTTKDIEAGEELVTSSRKIPEYWQESEDSDLREILLVDTNDKLLIDDITEEVVLRVPKSSRSEIVKPGKVKWKNGKPNFRRKKKHEAGDISETVTSGTSGTSVSSVTSPKAITPKIDLNNLPIKLDDNTKVKSVEQIDTNNPYTKILILNVIKNPTDADRSKATAVSYKGKNLVSSLLAGKQGSLMLPVTGGGNAKKKSQKIKDIGAVSEGVDTVKDTTEKSTEDAIKEAKKLQNKQIKSDKMKQQKLRLEKFRQDKMKQQKLKEEKLKAEKLKVDKLKEEKAREEKLKEEKLKQERLKQDKAKQDKLKQEKLKQEKLRQEKLQEEKVPIVIENPRKDGKRRSKMVLRDDFVHTDTIKMERPVPGGGPTKKEILEKKRRTTVMKTNAAAASRIGDELGETFSDIVRNTPSPPAIDETEIKTEKNDLGYGEFKVLKMEVNDGKTVTDMIINESNEVAKTPLFVFRVTNRHLVNDNTGLRLYKCEVCSSLYKTGYSLKRHFIHNHIYYKYIPTSDVTNCTVNIAEQLDTFTAPEEVRMFTSSGFTDSDEVPENVSCQNRFDRVFLPGLYRCDECRTLFDYLDDLISHDHNNPIPQAKKRTINCDQCPMKFLFMCNLTRHRTVHLGAKPHVCEICQQGYPTLFSLKKHKMVHTTGRFSCSYCTSTFARPQHVKRHIRTLHKEHVRRCSLCDMEFVGNISLTNHLYKVHKVGTKPEVERLADFKPVSDSDVEDINTGLAGYKKVDKDNRSPSKLDSVTKVSVKVPKVLVLKRNLSEELPESEFRFVCTVCKAKFRSYSGMCRHRRIIHSLFVHTKPKVPIRKKSPYIVPEPDTESEPEIWEEPNLGPIVWDDDFYDKVSANVANNFKYHIYGKTYDIWKQEQERAKDSGDVDSSPDKYSTRKYNPLNPSLSLPKLPKVNCDDIVEEVLRDIVDEICLPEEDIRDILYEMIDDIFEVEMTVGRLVQMVVDGKDVLVDSHDQIIEEIVEQVTDEVTEEVSAEILHEITEKVTAELSGSDKTVEMTRPTPKLSEKVTKIESKMLNFEKSEVLKTSFHYFEEPATNSSFKTNKVHQPLNDSVDKDVCNCMENVLTMVQNQISSPDNDNHSYSSSESKNLHSAIQSLVKPNDVEMVGSTICDNDEIATENLTVNDDNDNLSNDVDMNSSDLLMEAFVVSGNEELTSKESSALTHSASTCDVDMEAIPDNAAVEGTYIYDNRSANSARNENCMNFEKNPAIVSSAIWSDHQELKETMSVQDNDKQNTLDAQEREEMTENNSDICDGENVNEICRNNRAILNENLNTPREAAISANEASDIKGPVLTIITDILSKIDYSKTHVCSSIEPCVKKTMNDMLTNIQHSTKQNVNEVSNTGMDEDSEYISPNKRRYRIYRQVRNKAADHEFFNIGFDKLKKFLEPADCLLKNADMRHCNVCKEVFPNSAEYEIHFTESHRCSSDALDKLGLVNSQTPKTNDVVDPMFNEEFESYKFGAHGEIEYVCSVCYRSFNRKRKLTIHQKKRHKYIWCTHLQVESGFSIDKIHFKAPSASGVLLSPARASKCVSLRSEQLFVCSVCEKRFPKVTLLHNHILECFSLFGAPPVSAKSLKRQSSSIPSTPKKENSTKENVTPIKSETPAKNIKSETPAKTETPVKPAKAATPIKPASVVKTPKPKSQGNSPSQKTSKPASPPACRAKRKVDYKELAGHGQVKRSKSSGLKYVPEKHARRRDMSDCLESSQCRGCGLKFRSLCMLERHVKKCDKKEKLLVETKVVAQPKSSLICLYCHRFFTYHKSLLNHYTKDICNIKRNKEANNQVTEEDYAKEEEVIQLMTATIEMANSKKNSVIPIQKSGSAVLDNLMHKIQQEGIEEKKLESNKNTAKKNSKTNKLKRKIQEEPPDTVIKKAKKSTSNKNLKRDLAKKRLMKYKDKIKKSAEIQAVKNLSAEELAKKKKRFLFRRAQTMNKWKTMKPTRSSPRKNSPTEESSLNKENVCKPVKIPILRLDSPKKNAVNSKKITKGGAKNVKSKMAKKNQQKSKDKSPKERISPPTQVKETKKKSSPKKEKIPKTKDVLSLPGVKSVMSVMNKSCKQKNPTPKSDTQKTKPKRKYNKTKTSHLDTAGDIIFVSITAETEIPPKLTKTGKLKKSKSDTTCAPPKLSPAIKDEKVNEYAVQTNERSAMQNFELEMEGETEENIVLNDVNVAEHDTTSEVDAVVAMEIDEPPPPNEISDLDILLSCCDDNIIDDDSNEAANNSDTVDNVLLELVQNSHGTLSELVDNSYDNLSLFDTVYELSPAFLQSGAANS